MRRTFSALLLTLSLALSACGTYRVTVTQGNVVEEDRLAQLELGMTPVQVEYLLGTPLLRSPLTPQRWDYVLRVERGEETLRERRVTVYFAEGLVSAIEDTAAVDEEQSAPATTAAAG